MTIGCAERLKLLYRVLSAVPEFPLITLDKSAAANQS